MEKSFVRQHEAAVKREARSAESRWNKIIEADDIEQEIWLWLMERPGAQEYLSKGEPAQIASALQIRADTICSKNRLDYDHFTGNFHYTTNEVRKLLEKMFIEEHTIRTIDEDIDISMAMEDLEEESPQHFSVLYMKYAFGVEPDHTQKTVRAVDALTTLMNRKRSQRDLERIEGLGTSPTIPANSVYY